MKNILLNLTNLDCTNGAGCIEGLVTNGNIYSVDKTILNDSLSLLISDITMILDHPSDLVNVLSTILLNYED